MFKRFFLVLRSWFFPTQEEKDRFERLMRDAPEDEICSRLVTEITARNHISRMIADSERKIQRLGQQASRAAKAGNTALSEKLFQEQRELLEALEETRQLLSDAEEAVRFVKEKLKQQDREHLERFRRKVDELERLREQMERSYYGPQPPQSDWVNDPSTIWVGVLFVTVLFLLCMLIACFLR